MAKRYCEFFQPKPDYRPVMTKEGINATPEKWLNFYPHQTFVSILDKLFEKFMKGDRSVWIHGAYGTGKSHAALVIQKLFADDDDRVEKYLNEFSNEIPRAVADCVREWRRKKTLVVFRSGTDQVRTPQQLLVGIERSVMEECKERGYAIPAISGYEEILKRIEETEARFFAKRDEIQHELAHLDSDIKEYAQIKAKCEKDGGKFSEGILQDAEKVFAHDNVFLTLNAGRVLDWIDAIRKANGIGKIVFIWDEFSSYIDNAQGNLKTFEELAEAKAQQCGFHFVPVTHTELSAFHAVGSESARKANDRYTRCPLQIPANQVFRLGAHAFTRQNEDEWRREEELLWSRVSPMVGEYMAKHMPSSESVAADDFRQILPLHPMSAYLLRHMAEKVGSNQRSFFDYLCTMGGQSEFQRFLEEGGPDVANRQYLTPDYLWRYFIEREDAAADTAVRETETEFNSKKAALKIEDGGEEERVYKAALLYSLMEKKSGRGVQELLSPTVENVRKSFYGDGAVVDVEGILKRLEEKNCFSIVSGRVMPLITGQRADPSHLRGKFTELAAVDVGNDAKRKFDGYGDPARYEVRAYHGPGVKQSDVKNKSDYGEGSPKGGNKILVNFLLACTRQDTLAIPEKAQQMAKQFSGMRIIFVCPENISFCDERETQWEDYITLSAQAEAASDKGLREAHEKRAKDMLEKWKGRIGSGNTTLTVAIPADDPGDEPTVVNGVTWTALKTVLGEQKERWFHSGGDRYAMENRQLYLPSALANWALTGLTGQSPVPNGGQYRTYLQRLEKQGVDFSDGWFASNPCHPFTRLRDFWEKKRQNTIGQNGTCSVRRQYIELMRAPWGYEKNAFTAFAMGFAMRNWLTKNLQWTDGRVSQPLDARSLAEIIEAVVADNGDGRIPNEKTICRLSDEEKAFTSQIAGIFSLNVDKSATPESVLAMLGQKISENTGNIPLWMLPQYVREQPEETAAENICGVVQTLCEVIKTSSKPKDGTRGEKIKAIGKALLENDGLAEAIKKYMKPGTFIKAFDLHIGRMAPGLPESAAKAGDLSGEYRKSIVSRFSMDASWLWNEVDVSEALRDVENRYRFILAMQEIFSVRSWMDFETAQKKQQSAMTGFNKVSLEMLAASYPFVSELREQTRDSRIQGDALEKMCVIVETQKAEIEALFRDPEMKLPIEIISQSFGESMKGVTQDEWRQILDGVSGGAEMSENAFRDSIARQVKAFQEKSEGGRLVRLWKERTRSDNPDLWSAGTGLPAEVLFANAEEGRKIIGVTAGLGESGIVKIKEAYAMLERASLHDAQGQESAFIKRYLPQRYARLEIEANQLSQWFAAKLGPEPNRWRDNPAREEAVMEFVKKNYDSSFRSRAESRIRDMTAECAKAELLKLIAEIPDAGIAFLT